MNKGEGLSVVKRTEARNPLFLSLCLRSIKKDEMKKSRGKREEEKESAHLLIHAVERKVESRWKGGKRDEERKRGRGGCGGGGRMRGRGRGGGRKPRNNWRRGGGRISCWLASAPFKESLAFC